MIRPNSFNVRLVRFFVIGFCVALASSPSLADDQVFRKGSSRAIRGTIKNSKEHIEIKPRTGATQKIPADEIDYVRFNAEPPQLNVARSNEKAGLLDRALATYTQLLGSLKAGAKADTEFLIARTKARMAVADPSKVDDALQSLNGVLARNSNGFRHFEILNWIGQVQVSKGDFAAAKEQFGKIGQSNLSSYKMTAGVATGRVLLAEQNATAAEKAFDTVAAMNANTLAEKSSHFDAVLGKARCQQLNSSFTEAVAALDKVIQETDWKANSDLHAKAYLQKGDCYRDQQQFKKARTAYLHVDLIYFRDQKSHAEALFRLAELFPKLGKPERGTEARAKLKKLYPNNEWAKKLGA